MPLRYLNLTLIVTKRETHCFLILSYRACCLMSQPDISSEAVGILLPFSIHCSTETWCTHVQNTQKVQSLPLGAEILKDLFHYSILIFWGGWLPRVLEDSGWLRGPWSGSCRGSWVSKHTCVQRAPHFPNWTVILPLLVQPVFFNF